MLSSVTLANADNLSNGVSHIDIIGRERVESDAIRSLIDIQPGETITPSKIDSALKKLFASGLFSDVKINIVGSKIIVKVVENPIINKMVFEGNSKIKHEDLSSGLILRPRMVFSKLKLQADINYVLMAYNKSGRYGVKIKPQIIKLPQNRIDLVFEIDEGPKTPVKKILFMGNNRFNDYKLAPQLTTKEQRWYRFFSSSDNYDPDRLAYDQDRLTKFYQNNGYADFTVTATHSNISKAKDFFTITFVMEEGEKYKFGKTSVTSQIKKLDVTNLQTLPKTIEGKLFNRDEIEQTVDLLTKNLNDQGYAFVAVSAVPQRDVKNHIISINYMIEEGSRAYINRINITGNRRTLDKVIRREFRLAEGDAYNESFIKRSEDRINDLDYFEKVVVTKAATNMPDKIDINVKVEEKSTASLNLSGGYSTTDKIIGTIGVTERNFLGTGNELGVNFFKASKKVDFSISYTNPHFMDYEVLAGIELFTRGANKRDAAPYDSKEKGFVLRSGYAITEYLTHTQSYTLKKGKIFNLSDKATPFNKAEEGPYNTSMIGHALIYNKATGGMKPNNGYIIRLDQAYAGLGSNNKYIKHDLGAKYYLPLHKEDVVLKLAANIGHIKGIRQGIRPVDRYYIGDDTLRGFASGGIGPRDRSADPTTPGNTLNDALGGTFYYTTTAELMFPLGLPKELEISGSAFVEVGGLHGLNLSNSMLNKKDIWKTNAPRVSIGTGVTWITRIGPLRFDVALPLKKGKYDKTQSTHFSFSTNF